MSRYKLVAKQPTFIYRVTGLGYAAGYKIAQRVYKFGGQPYFRDVIDRSSAKPYFTDAFGAKWGKMVIHATAGSLTGMGEVVSNEFTRPYVLPRFLKVDHIRFDRFPQVLLPLDVLKIKMQTNPEAFRGRGIVKLISDEGIASLYKGWGWTMGRNAPGSFAVSEGRRLSFGTRILSNFRYFSCSEVPLSRRSTFSSFPTTRKLPGVKVSFILDQSAGDSVLIRFNRLFQTSLLLLPVPSPRSLSPHH